MSDPSPSDTGAYCRHGTVHRSGLPAGPLSGLRFAVKDLIDVAGVPTGAGSPDWLASHPPPEADAPVVARILAGGADLTNKTKTDELAWSLTGQNAHYGTPLNPAAPDRLPGGSSSGSASAVAAGDVDFALGTDTGGSVRLPASFCGLYGLRPTHGRIPAGGVVPLAPSYDVVGWFARTAATLAAVGPVALDAGAPAAPPRRLLLADDLFALADAKVREALEPSVRALADQFGGAERLTLAGDDLALWREAFRVLQAAEAWRTHGAWISQVSPRLGPGVRERFAAAARLSDEEIAAAATVRAAARRRLQDVVPPDAILLLPSAPSIAPSREATPDELDAMRARSLLLLCPAGHAGLPQLSLPAGSAQGAPVGLSLLGAAGADESLLALAVQVSADG
jgi:amidase